MADKFVGKREFSENGLNNAVMYVVCKKNLKAVMYWWNNVYQFNK